jgi:hypothetical protein
LFENKGTLDIKVIYARLQILYLRQLTDSKALSAAEITCQMTEQTSMSPVVRRHVTENLVLSRILDITRVNQAKLLRRNKNATAWFLAPADVYKKRHKTMAFAA